MVEVERVIRFLMRDKQRVCVNVVFGWRDACTCTGTRGACVFLHDVVNTVASILLQSQHAVVMPNTTAHVFLMFIILLLFDF